MKKKLFSQEDIHKQCVKEIVSTLALAGITLLWHTVSAWLLNDSDLYFLGMPAWFSISTLGSIIIANAGLWILLKKVFVNFDYETEEENSHGHD